VVACRRVVLGQKPRESKLVQDLLATVIYLAAALAIVAYVFDLPVRGLLATSGALAIIIGLALQSSLGDVFSGLVLNLERPYRVGDSIILDDTVQGTVIETNWRATHILTGNSDVAIVPNSIVAKSKLVNCSTPTKMHGAKLRVRLEPSMPPATGCTLLQEALLGSTRILRTPQASVVVKDISAEAMEFELGFSVADISGVDAAQSELFDRIYRAVAAGGMRFAPRLASNTRSATADVGTAGVAEKLIGGIALFGTLSRAEKSALAAKMSRKDFRPGDMVTQAGVVSQTLCIVSDGVLSATEERDGVVTERLRLTPGSYFGETGLLTGESSKAGIRALTRTVIYEISKDALCPLLISRPSMADELSETLAELQLGDQLPEGGHLQRDSHKARLAARVADSIRHLFSLH
jgi:CRP-like cAMP-binding protein